MIGKAFNYRTEYKEIKDKEKQLEELEKKLTLIDESALQNDLLNSKK